MPLFHNKNSFLKAAREGDVEELVHCLGYKVSYGKFSIDVQDETGITALSHAARRGDTAIVKLLMYNGADLELADKDGITPLMAATQAGRSDAAVALIEGGAKVDTHNGDYVYPLHMAAFTGDMDVVKALVAAKADINVAIRTNGRTPLHWALDKEMASVVEFLVKSGARTDIADKGGQTAMDIAKKKKLPHLLQLLGVPTVVQAVPAAAATAGEATDRWVLSGKARVSHTGTYPEIGRRLTEVFNFESRERIVITENLKTGAENLTPPESFDNISEDALKKAFSEFRRLGGKADEGFVMGGKTAKISLKLPK